MTLRQKYKSEYKAFIESRCRCNNKKLKNYNIYGGRGIKHKIDTFEEFFNHLGPRPSKNHSLDRIDNDGNYEIGNIRWATKKEQNRNWRHSIKYSINGEEKTLIEWCEIYNINYKSVYRRIRRLKWSVEKALNTPILPCGRENTSGVKGLYWNNNRRVWVYEQRIEGKKKTKNFKTKSSEIQYIRSRKCQ